MSRRNFFFHLLSRADFFLVENKAHAHHIEIQPLRHSKASLHLSPPFSRTFLLTFFLQAPNAISLFSFFVLEVSGWSSRPPVFLLSTLHRPGGFSYLFLGDGEVEEVLILFFLRSDDDGPGSVPISVLPPPNRFAWPIF